MQGNYGAAITHVQSGIHILCQVKYHDESRQHDAHGAFVASYVPINILEDMFMHLDLQVIQVRIPDCAIDVF